MREQVGEAQTRIVLLRLRQGKVKKMNRLGSAVEMQATSLGLVRVSSLSELANLKYQAWGVAVPELALGE